MVPETDLPPDDGPPVVLRGPDGRFLPGSASPSPGRPRREVEDAYLTALTDGVSLEAWQDIIAKAVTMAKAGDSRARNWLSTWLLPVRVDPNLMNPQQAGQFVTTVLNIVVPHLTPEVAVILRDELRRLLETRQLI